jgi:hypothetical protein
VGANDCDKLRGGAVSLDFVSLLLIFILIASITPRDLLALIATKRSFLLIIAFFFLDRVLRFFLDRAVFSSG